MIALTIRTTLPSICIARLLIQPRVDGFALLVENGRRIP
jgi:hypothetical protein